MNQDDLVSVIVIGAGIRGASLAGMLAATGDYIVTLIERDSIGSGTTATNHGRLHSGTWNYPENRLNGEVIKRNKRTRELLDILPKDKTSLGTGYYYIEKPEDVKDFKEFCIHHRLNVSEHFEQPKANVWLGENTDKYFTSFNIPDTSFNPARIADKFVGFADTTGRCTVVFCQALKISETGKGLTVDCSDGLSRSADLVINSTGRWINSVVQEDSQPNHASWKRWRLLAVRANSSEIASLDRVITIQSGKSKVDMGNKPIVGFRESYAAVPHEGWIIFGNDPVREEIENPEHSAPVKGQVRDQTHQRWRPFDETKPEDVEIFDSLVEYFPNLSHVRKNYKSNLFTFSGVIAELDLKGDEDDEASEGNTPKAYAVSTMSPAENLDGYYQILGGSATTALADSEEFLKQLVTEKFLKSWVGDDQKAPTMGALKALGDNYIKIAALVEDVVAVRFVPFANTKGMIWEHWPVATPPY